jgi:Restriction endonuclease
MEALKPVYGRGRYPKFRKSEDGKKLCRGCGADVPKGRQSWCSTACYTKYEPASVKHQVRQRDKGICQMCNVKTRDHPSIRKWEVSDAERLAAPKAEYDHIVPFSEGGLTVLENMRTLCNPCHKKRTAEWRKLRKRARELIGQLTF